MSPPTSPLYSTVVLAGLALTAGAAACGEETPRTALDAAVGKDGDGAQDVGDAGDAATAKPSDASCPPDSERPTPPCSFIL